MTMDDSLTTFIIHFVSVPIHPAYQNTTFSFVARVAFFVANQRAGNVYKTRWREYERFIFNIEKNMLNKFSEDKTYYG